MRQIADSIDPFKHGTIALVAVAYTALAVQDGGYSQNLTAGATVAVWLAVAIGAVARAWPRRPVPKAALIAGGCLAALGLLTALSMIWAGDAGRAFFAFVRVGGYLGLFTLVVLSAPRSGKRAWLAGLTVGLTVVCLVALGTRFDPSLFGGSDRQLSSVLPTSVGRLSYPIGYWNGLAACVAIQAVLLAWFGAQAWERLWRAIAVALVPLPVLALYLTSSRGGFVAAMAGWLVLLAFEREKPALVAGTALGVAGGAVLILFAHDRDAFLNGLGSSTAKDQGLEMGLASLACVVCVGAARYLLDARVDQLRLPQVSWRIVAPAAIAVAAVAAFAINPAGRVDERSGRGNKDDGAAGSGHLLSTSGSDRSQYWEAALKAFEYRPIAGVGAGNYVLFWNAHPQVEIPVLNAHSLYLETLAELGLIGLALILGFFVMAALAGWRGRAASGGEVAAALAVLAAGAVSAGVEWTWQIPAAFIPIIAAAGLLTLSGHNGRAAGRAPVRANPSSRFGLGVALIGIGWVSIWGAGIVLISNLNLDSSRAAAERGDLAEAAGDARDAATVEPWSPEPRLQLALVDEAGGNLKAARKAAGEAIRRAHNDWRTWAVAARIDAKAGNRHAAVLEIVRARQLSPVRLPSEFVTPIRRRIGKSPFSAAGCCR